MEAREGLWKWGCSGGWYVGEGVGLRVLKNGDGEGSPSLVLGVGEKEREMGLREEL
ncbi:hypothetical protein NC653_007154 [Populus alba x Populus x berolinensis]|uniref:Uncharacterized protein n=1 Tax=Populus alba x Populus x berolinensis TaxID=444605 RepID=A0AAD6WD49_9ROSI|nr:hypothetical protein NC653_007154 [Populus alba x Populus x berolinensis]